MNWPEEGMCEKQDTLRREYDEDINHAISTNSNSDWEAFFKKEYRCNCETCEAVRILGKLEG